MFKINDKNTISVSIVNFKQVNVSWIGFAGNAKESLLNYVPSAPSCLTHPDIYAP